jgi:hypothetical protein
MRPDRGGAEEPPIHAQGWIFSLAQTRLETVLLAGRVHRGIECRQGPSMSITGIKDGCSLTLCFCHSSAETRRHEESGISELPVRETCLFPVAHGTTQTLVFRRFCRPTTTLQPSEGKGWYFAIIASQAIIEK